MVQAANFACTEFSEVQRSPGPTPMRVPSSLRPAAGFCRRYSYFLWEQDGWRNKDEDRFDRRPVLRVRQDAGVLAGSAPLRTKGARAGRLGGPSRSRGKRSQRVSGEGSGAFRAHWENQQGALGPLHERPRGRGGEVGGDRGDLVPARISPGCRLYRAGRSRRQPLLRRSGPRGGLDNPYLPKCVADLANNRAMPALSEGWQKSLRRVWRKRDAVEYRRGTGPAQGRRRGPLLPRQPPLPLE